MRISRLAILLGLLVVPALAFVLMSGVPEDGEADKPIIAHMLASPGVYDRRTVTIYGLVIETSSNGSEFLLQDVSQMPLKIVRTDGVATAAGDQILVEGVFSAGGQGPHLKATRIEKTKVLGGGGCC